VPIDGGARTRARLKLSGVIRSSTGIIIALLLSASGATAGGCAAAWFEQHKGYPASDAANAAYGRLCRSLAEQGNAEAQFDFGSIYARGYLVPQDYAEALKWYRKSGEGGYGIAQVTLGDLYHSGSSLGLHVQPDFAEAEKWWRKAADQGYTNVLADLGHLYDQVGNSVLAEIWYRKAAELGDRHGQFGLGRLYADGNSVPQDYVLAHMWLNLAAAQGLEDAKSARDKIASKMTPAQIAEAQRLAREWKPKE
jgi:TPR repeat protein